MRWHGLRMTLRGSMAVVALLAGLLAFCIVPLTRVIERQRKRSGYAQVASGMCYAIFALENRVPQCVDASDWQSAVQLTARAEFNTCHLWYPPPIEELYRLREELTLKLRGPVDVQTLYWIWDRLASSCDDGKDHTDRFRGELDACFRQGNGKGHQGTEPSATYKE
jgi:hypothetical protein